MFNYILSYENNLRKLETERLEDTKASVHYHVDEAQRINEKKLKMLY